MKILEKQTFTGERALFDSHSLDIRECVFKDGESPLKESSDISLVDSVFAWKYPLWYGNNFRLENCTLEAGARAGIWYTKNVCFSGTLINAPKSFRRSSGITLKNVTFTDAAETLWHCNGVVLDSVKADNGDYFAMNSNNVTVDGLTLNGNYSFDGAKNVEIRNSRLISKDAFWNSENVVVYNSFISGEYLGWNAKNLTLIDCTVESLQGLCYIENLVMRNCKLINTPLAFEYSSVDAQIATKSSGIKNPLSGRIEADEIGEIIMEKDKVDVAATKIIVGGSELTF